VNSKLLIELQTIDVSQIQSLSVYIGLVDWARAHKTTLNDISSVWVVSNCHGQDKKIVVQVKVLPTFLPMPIY
jgi:hypothetical protein